MAVTVEELQIVLQCDATQAQAALNSLNTAVDKAVKKISSIESTSGKSSPIERTSEKIEEANKKLNSAFSSNKMGGLRDFFRGIKEGWNEARKEREAALEPPPKQSTRGMKAADALGYNQPSFAVPNIEDTRGMKAADAIARLNAAQENVSKDNDGAAQSIKKTGDAAEQATKKVERYANATRKTGKSFSFFSRLSKAAHGVFDKFGKSIRKHEGFFEKFGKTLKRVVMRMLAMGLVRGVINGIRQGLQLLAKSSDAAAQQFGQFSAMGKAIKVALGSAALSVLNALSGVLFSIAQAAVTAANAVAQFFAVISGSGKYIGVTLAGSFDDLGDSIGGAGGAAKGLLADFDELNIIGQKGGGGGGGGLNGVSGVTTGEQDAVSILADLLNAGQFEEAGAYIAQKLDEVVLKIDNWFIDLDNKHYGTKFAEIVNGIFSDKQLFEDAGKTVGDGINTIIHPFDEFTETFDGKEAGEALAAGVNTMVDTVDWESAGDSVSQGLNKITDAIKEFFTDFDGDALGKALATAISNAIVGIDESKIGAASIVMLINAIDFILSFLANMNWVGILSGLVEFIVSAPVQILEGILARPSNLIRIIKNSLVLLAKVTLGILVGLISGIIQGVFDRIVAVFDIFAPGLIDKIAPWTRNIGDTINNGFNEGVDKAAGAFDVLANYVDEKMGYIDDSWRTHSDGIEQSTDSMVSTLDGSKGILDEYKSKMEEMATATDKVSDAMNNIPEYKESTIKINTVVTSSGSVSGGAGGGKPNVNITLMKMAQGGIAYGSTLANIGEYPTARSNPEVVAPLSNLRKILESGKGGVNSADVRKQNELLQEQNRLLRVIAQKELRIYPSPELGQVVTKSQALFGNV